MSIDKLKSKFFNGSFINDVKHYFSKINEIIDYLNDDQISGGGLSGLTTNKVLKATSSTTAGNSNITDNSTTTNSTITLNDGQIQLLFNNGTQYGYYTVNSGGVITSFTNGSNSGTCMINAGSNNLTHSVKNTFSAPLHEFNNSVTKGGVEVATVNDILGGATGSFTTNDGKTITVTNGRITAIV